MAKIENNEKKPGLGIGKGVNMKKGKYPNRTAINLVYQPSHKERDILSLVMFGLFLIALLIFTKFMVIDQLAAVNAASGAYHAKEDQLKALETKNREFDEVEDEYSHYGISYMTEEELNRQYRTEILKVIDEKVSDSYGIKNIVISGNTATLSFQVPELKDVSSIVGSLNESPIVNYVTFTTAATEDRRVEVVDENGNKVIESVRGALNATITVYFKTPAAVIAAEEGGEA